MNFGEVLDKFWTVLLGRFWTALGKHLDSFWIIFGHLWTDFLLNIQPTLAFQSQSCKP